MQTEQSVRTYERYATGPWGNEAQVTLGNDRLNAEIIDQSLGGLGLVVRMPREISLGQYVRIDNGSFERKARLVFSQLAGETVRLGIEWTPDSDYLEIVN